MLLHLPEDVFAEVASLLPEPSLLTLAVTSRGVGAMVDSDAVWRPRPLLAEPDAPLSAKDAASHTRGAAWARFRSRHPHGAAYNVVRRIAVACAPWLLGLWAFAALGPHLLPDWGEGVSIAVKTCLLMMALADFLEGWPSFSGMGRGRWWERSEMAAIVLLTDARHLVCGDSAQLWASQHHLDDHGVRIGAGALATVGAAMASTVVMALLHLFVPWELATAMAAEHLLWLVCLCAWVAMSGELDPAFLAAPVLLLLSLLPELERAHGRSLVALLLVGAGTFCAHRVAQAPPRPPRAPVPDVAWSWGLGGWACVVAFGSVSAMVTAWVTHLAISLPSPDLTGQVVLAGFWCAAQLGLWAYLAEPWGVLSVTLRLHPVAIAGVNGLLTVAAHTLWLRTSALTSTAVGTWVALTLAAYMELKSPSGAEVEDEEEEEEEDPLVQLLRDRSSVRAFSLSRRWLVPALAALAAATSSTPSWSADAHISRMYGAPTATLVQAYEELEARGELAHASATDVGPLRRLTELSLELEDYEAARRWAERVAEKEKEEQDWMRLGRSLVGLGDRDAAALAFERVAGYAGKLAAAEALLPTRPEAAAALFAETLSAFAEEGKTGTRLARAWSGLALAREGLHDWDGACEAYGSAVEEMRGWAVSWAVELQRDRVCFGNVGERGASQRPNQE